MEFLVFFNTLLLILAGSLLTYTLANKSGAKSAQVNREKK